MRKKNTASDFYKNLSITKEDFKNKIFEYKLKPQDIGLLAYLTFKKNNAQDCEIIDDFFLDRRTLNKILENISKKMEK